MSYVSIPLNLSERNYPFKPKPRYTTSDEERNSLGSPSPPRPGTVLSDIPPQPNWIADQFKYLNNPYIRGIPSIPHPHGMEWSSTFPYSLDCASPHLPALRTSFPAVLNGSHYGYHPHPYYHMKMSPPFPGYDQLFYSSMRRPKRIRTAFTPNQLLTLEKAFEKNHYVVGSERKQLAQILGLSETQVKVWFQNRRTKNKRQKQDGESCSEKNSSKDCLDCREDDFSDESSSDDETICSNPSPVVSESCENTPKTVSRAIWNPISIEERILPSQSVINDRAE